MDPIWQTKTETAARVRGRIKSIFDWAIYKGFRDGSNPARWEQNLQHQLPSPTKLKNGSSATIPAHMQNAA